MINNKTNCEESELMPFTTANQCCGRIDLIPSVNRGFLILQTNTPFGMELRCVGKWWRQHNLIMGSEQRVATRLTGDEVILTDKVEQVKVDITIPKRQSTVPMGMAPLRQI